MANMQGMPVIEDPFSTDAEPASHPSRPRARNPGRRVGAVLAAR
jgi:hypothetical protein